MTHTDGFFQGADGQRRGMASALEIARFYAAKPRRSGRARWCSWRFPTTITASTAAALVHQDLRLEQGGADPDVEHTVADAALHGEPGHHDVERDQRPPLVCERQPGVSAAGEEDAAGLQRVGLQAPERSAGGSLGALTPFAPAFHIIDHVIYHTTLDTPELVPAVGLANSARAFLKVLDEANKMTMAELRGTAKLPNPIR